MEVNGAVFPKPFVEKPVSAEDHNVYIYYPSSAGGGSQRLFRKVRETSEHLGNQRAEGQSEVVGNGEGICGQSLETEAVLLPFSFLLKIGSRSSVYSPESSVRKTGSYIYEEFMPTDGTDVKVMVDTEIFKML